MVWRHLGTTWGQEAGTYSHEMGHSLGLPHSGWAYYAYDSPWDMMKSGRASASTTVCGSYSSRNDSGGTRNVGCTEPGNGYIAPHKGQRSPGSDSSSERGLNQFNRQRNLHARRRGAGAWLATETPQVCLSGVSCSGAGAHYLSVEARVKALGGSSQFDNAIQHEDARSKTCR